MYLRVHSLLAPRGFLGSPNNMEHRDKISLMRMSMSNKNNTRMADNVMRLNDDVI